MAVYFIVTAAGLLLFGLAGIFLVLLVRGGQLDDLDTPPIRMLHDDHTVLGQSSEGDTVKTTATETKDHT